MAEGGEVRGIWFPPDSILAELSPGDGARLTNRTECSDCGARIAKGDRVRADLAGNLDGTWHHTDCSDPKLERPALMDRAEAIGAVVGVWRELAGEFCVGDAERKANDQECHDVLSTLGCTPAEIEAAGLRIHAEPESPSGDGGYPRDPELRAAVDRLST